MTLTELRALTPATFQERYLVEVAAQMAELNEKFDKFIASMRPTSGGFLETLHPESSVANTETKRVFRRTAIAEK